MGRKKYSTWTWFDIYIRFKYSVQMGKKKQHNTSNSWLRCTFPNLQI